MSGGMIAASAGGAHLVAMHLDPIAGPTPDIRREAKAALPETAATTEHVASAPSLEELLMPLLSAAYGAALNLTRNRADAEDLVQDAALHAVRGFETFEAGTNFKAWFFRILYNCFLSKHRRRRAERGMMGLEDAAEFYVLFRAAEVGLRPGETDPVAATIGRLQSEQVAAALRDLPDEYRAVATMYFIEDFSYQEIADMLGVPVGTVRSRLHRGRKMLQKRLWQLAVDQGLTSPRGGAVESEAV
jgi:RNA polymerase sigma-70 factor (ECF subfamily)